MYWYCMIFYHEQTKWRKNDLKRPKITKIQKGQKIQNLRILLLHYSSLMLRNLRLMIS